VTYRMCERLRVDDDMMLCNEEDVDCHLVCL